MRTTNLLILRGYTGGAPKAFGNGRIAKVSVATNRSWIDKTTGDRVEKTDWVTVTILNEQDAKFALANVRKGSPIYAECRVAELSYQKDGRTIYGVDIVAEVFRTRRRLRRLRSRSMPRNRSTLRELSVIGWDWRTLRRVRRDRSECKRHQAANCSAPTLRATRTHRPTTLDEIRRARPGRRIDREE